MSVRYVFMGMLLSTMFVIKMENDGIVATLSVEKQVALRTKEGETEVVWNEGVKEGIEED